MNFAAWNWAKIDEIVASFARPYQSYICSSAVAFSAVWSVCSNSSDVVVGICVPAATALAGGTAYLRSVDKKTAATADVAKTVGTNAP
jgi:hypothetical protein